MGLGEGERGQRRADLIAYRERRMELAVLGGRDDHIVEPAAESAARDDTASLSLRTDLYPVVDLPSLTDVVAEGVEEPVPLEQIVHVPLIRFARVVGVLPAAPAVFVVEILRQVPLPAVGNQGPGVDAHAVESRRLGSAGIDRQLSQRRHIPEGDRAHQEEKRSEKASMADFHHAESTSESMVKKMETREQRPEYCARRTRGAKAARWRRRGVGRTWTRCASPPLVPDAPAAPPHSASADTPGSPRC